MLCCISFLALTSTSGFTSSLVVFKSTRSFNREQPMFIRPNKSTNSSRVQFAVSMLLFFPLLSGVHARGEPDKGYLRIEQNQSSETNDLKITSIGALIFKKNMMGHVDLTQLKSDMNGKDLALEFGGGYVFNWKVSLFLGLGISLGYNSDKDDYIAAYFPQAGIVVDITQTFGISVSAKRYHHLHEEEDTFVMMGLVFRN